MSYLIDLTLKKFNGLHVIKQLESKYDHAYWKVYCTRCHRYDTTSTNVLFSRLHNRCSKCFNVRLTYDEGIDIVKKLDNGYKKKTLCEEYDCSYSAITTAVKTVIKAEKFIEKELDFKEFKK